MAPTTHSDSDRQLHRRRLHQQYHRSKAPQSNGHALPLASLPYGPRPVSILLGRWTLQLGRLQHQASPRDLPRVSPCHTRWVIRLFSTILFGPTLNSMQGCVDPRGVPRDSPLIQTGLRQSLASLSMTSQFIATRESSCSLSHNLLMYLLPRQWCSLSPTIFRFQHHCMP